MKVFVLYEHFIKLLKMTLDQNPAVFHFNIKRVKILHLHGLVDAQEVPHYAQAALLVLERCEGHGEGLLGLFRAAKVELPDAVGVLPILQAHASSVDLSSFANSGLALSHKGIGISWRHPHTVVEQVLQEDHLDFGSLEVRKAFRIGPNRRRESRIGKQRLGLAGEHVREHKYKIVLQALHHVVERAVRRVPERGLTPCG